LPSSRLFSFEVASSGVAFEDASAKFRVFHCSGPPESGPNNREVLKMQGRPAFEESPEFPVRRRAGRIFGRPLKWVGGLAF
jgi:hypothetical protein